MLFFHIYTVRTVPQLHPHQTCSPTLKAEPLIQELSLHFQKATLLSAFLTWSQFPSILASLSKPTPCQQLGVDEAKKKRHLKLNLKMCFSWKPGCVAINQGRHFHAPHFSWFLSEFPPFLSHSTLAPELPTAALAADHNQRGTVGRPVPPTGSWSLPYPSLCRQSSPGCPWLTLSVENPSKDPTLGHHYPSVLSPPSSNNTWSTYADLMANSNRLYAERPQTYHPVFNVAMKEPFYCRLQTVVLSQPCVAYTVICEGCRGLVLIRSVKWSFHRGQILWVMYTLGGGLGPSAGRPLRRKHKKGDVKSALSSHDLSSAANFHSAHCNRG